MRKTQFIEHENNGCLLLNALLSPPLEDLGQTSFPEQRHQTLYDVREDREEGNTEILHLQTRIPTLWQAKILSRSKCN